jgi:hypothetical protein
MLTDISPFERRLGLNSAQSDYTFKKDRNKKLTLDGSLLKFD